MNTVETREQDERELKFSIVYSYYFEKFMFKFYSRLEKLILFILMILSVIEITGVFNTVITGVISIILIFILIVSRAGAKSQAAKTLYQEYLNLYQDFDNRDRDTVKRLFRSIQEKDNEEINYLAHPAFAAAAQRLLGDNILFRKLSFLERMYVLFIGETIKS